MKFWIFFTFFVIWLADWKWNLVSGWTTLEHRIDNRQNRHKPEYTSREVYSLWSRIEKMLFRPISEKQNSLSFNKVCQWLTVGRWFSLCTPVFSTKTKTDRHDIAELLLKVASNTISPTQVYLSPSGIWLSYLYTISVPGVTVFRSHIEFNIPFCYLWIYVPTN